MLGKSHTMMALIAVSPLASYAPQWALPYIIGGALLGSLFPDLDEPQSTIGRSAFIVSLLLSLFTKHRGITHTVVVILLYIIVSILMFIFIPKPWMVWAAVAFVVGNIMHIMGDMLTFSGVEILYPMIIKKFYLLPESLRFRTGGSLERFVLLPALSICVAVIYLDKTIPIFKSLTGTHSLYY